MLAVPIDLAAVWINEDGEVVDARLARYVLEMSTERWGDYMVGDKVSFEEISRH